METAELRYDWADADVYEAFMGRWSEHLAGPFLNQVNVTAGSNVLDVGCGTGVLARALAEAGARVIGVDASEGYLEGTRRLRAHPNIAYEAGALAEDLGFAPIKLGSLSEGGLLVQSRVDSWGPLIFQHLVKFD